MVALSCDLLTYETFTKNTSALHEATMTNEEHVHINTAAVNAFFLRFAWPFIQTHF